MTIEILMSGSMKAHCLKGGGEKRVSSLLFTVRVFLLRGIQNNSKSYTLIKVLINSSLRAFQMSKELRVNTKLHPNKRMPDLPDR